MLKYWGMNNMYQANPKEDFLELEINNKAKIKAIKGYCKANTFNLQIKKLKEMGIEKQDKGELK